MPKTTDDDVARLPLCATVEQVKIIDPAYLLPECEAVRADAG